MIFLPLFLSFLFILCLYLWVVFITKSSIHTTESLPHAELTLVLGAGLKKNGYPSDILADRVETALNVLLLNKTDRLILSGSANADNYCEPEAMSAMAKSLGAHPSKLILDKSGKSTFDSFVSFYEKFGSQRLIVVTQKFHLPRAIWLAKSLKLNVVGFPANQYRFSAFKIAFWHFREVFAIPANLYKLLRYRVLKSN